MDYVRNCFSEPGVYVARWMDGNQEATVQLQRFFYVMSLPSRIQRTRKKTAAMLMYKEIEASGDRWRGILIMLLVCKENSAM